MIELTEAMLKVLDEQGGQPLRLVDPRSGMTYLLVRADLFERMQNDEDEFDGIDVGKLVAEAMREDDEGDPHLEKYQQDYGLPE
jgi:hypothetical protein